jgi:hypothetical protein
MFNKLVVLLLVVSIFSSILAGCGGSSITADQSDAQRLLADINIKGRSLYNQPGWVHVIQKITYDTDKEDRGSLPNGKTIPLVQVIDIWYHINEQKLVYEYVWSMSTQDGQLIDINVFRNNTIYDLTNNISSAQNPYTLTLDYQFANELDDFVSTSGNHPVVTTREYNGRKATIFTLEEKLDSPRTSEDFSQPITASGSIVYFDSESGFILRLERIVTLADGSKRTFYTDNLTIETGLQPPQEIQNYVAGIF